MILAHVIALDPTVIQANALKRAAGVSRSTYNWALREWLRQRAVGLKPMPNGLKKQFNAIKREEFPWVYESPRDANAHAFTDLGTGISNYFKSCKGERKGRRIGFPRFRKKGQNDSFYVANDKFDFSSDGKHVRLPVIGEVRIHESLRLAGKIMSGRVRLVAGRWYLSVNVETEARVPTTPLRSIVGIDLGVKTAIVPSRGEPIDSPKPLKKALVKLRRANRILHRREKGSKNRHKAQMRVARIHQRIANVRKDFMHKVTTRLCRENQAIVIEDLNVAGMLKLHSLARAISDVGFGMFRTFLTYKGPIFGCEITVANRWYPSTQRCSRCGVVRKGDEKIVLGEHEYVCLACGLVEDRDRNAAMNLEQYPQLGGNWDREIRTSTEIEPLLSRAAEASMIAEVETCIQAGGQISSLAQRVSDALVRRVDPP